MTAFIRAIGWMEKALSTSETSVNFQETTRRHIPQAIFILAAVRT
jgi:hypothetical protein